MKKFLIALLAVLLCLTFVACGPDPAETTTGPETEDDTTIGGGEETPDVTTPEETTEPEVVDSDTLSVGEDDNTEFGPINQ